MARRIIIKNRNVDDSGHISVDLVFWCDVPVARQPFYANAAFVSSVNDNQLANTEKTALVNGVVTEIPSTQNFPIGTSLAAIQAALINMWQQQQAAINAYNPWSVYGTSWDNGTNVWTPKTVA